MAIAPVNQYHTTSSSFINLLSEVLLPANSPIREGGSFPNLREITLSGALYDLRGMLHHVVTLDIHRVDYVTSYYWMHLLQEVKALEVLRLGVLEILQYTNAFPVTLCRLRSLELREGDPTLVYAFLRDLIAPDLHNISIWLPLDYTLSGSTAGNILLSFVSSSYASPLQ